VKFRSVRIQMIEPCHARCAWCSTHKKNPTFRTLVNNREAAEFHALYAEVIERHQPEELFISGGEPLLSADLLPLLEKVAHIPKTIHIFTSYQFARPVMERIAQRIYPENVVFNHTTIYFEPDRWLKLTGFPFDVYADNVRRAVAMPVRKRFKFIVNHSQLAEEIQRFQELVVPNDTCEISLKVMNDQGNGMVVDTMQKSADRVHERLGKLDAVLEDAGWNQRRPRTSADRVAKVIETGDVTQCPYRESPLELRLAFYRGGDGKSVVKYRYCPYFPPDFGHKFHLGRDDLRKFGRNFAKGPFRDHCGDCRLLHYQGTGEVPDGD